MLIEHVLAFLFLEKAFFSIICRGVPRQIL